MKPMDKVSSPFTSMIGRSTNPGCVLPSMVTESEMRGRAVAGMIVCTPLPIANAMVSCPDVAFASVMAARSVQVPGPAVLRQMPLPGTASSASPVTLTVNVAAIAAPAQLSASIATTAISDAP